MKIKSLIRCAALGALMISAIPYQIKKDKETGGVYARSLLWAWKKVPRGEGEEKDSYFFSIPASALDDVARTAADASESAPEGQ